MEDTPCEDEPHFNTLLREKFFFKSSIYIDSINKKFDNIIATALKNFKAYEPWFNNFNHFALTFHFFHLRNVTYTVLIKSCYEQI